MLDTPSALTDVVDALISAARQMSSDGWPLSLLEYVVSAQAHDYLARCVREAGADLPVETRSAVAEAPARWARSCGRLSPARGCVSTWILTESPYRHAERV